MLSTSFNFLKEHISQEQSVSLESPPGVKSSSSDLDVLSVTFFKSAVTNDISSGKYEPAFPR